MILKIFSQFLFVLQLLFYSAIASAAIKYVAPKWSLLSELSIDTTNAIALYAITVPVALLAFALWLKRS